MVLWTFAVISVLAGEFARAMREEAQSTLNYKNETIAHYIAIAGLNEALLAIVAHNGKVETVASNATGEHDLDKEEESAGERTVRRLLLGRGDWIDARFDGSEYQVRVFDETGKISLNAEVLDESNLPIILENLGLDEDTANLVSDSILDWRDDNDVHRNNGAEDDYYEGLERPYPAKDGPFDSVEELLLVRGVTRQIFYGDAEFPGLRDVFTTVHSSSRVNISAVSPAVEVALCGEQLLDEEKQKDDDPFGPSEDEFFADLSTCLGDLNFPVRRATGRTRARLNQATVEVRVVAPDVPGQRPRTVSQIGAAVWFKEDGFQTLRWYDSVFSEESR
jgi:general secretion pathway protein K